MYYNGLASTAAKSVANTAIICDFIINNKDRIAQMILIPVIKMELEETDNLPDTLRGDGGFGSTGK